MVPEVLLELNWTFPFLGLQHPSLSRWTIGIKVEVLPWKRLHRCGYEGDCTQGRILRFNSMSQTGRAERGESETISFEVSLEMTWKTTFNRSLRTVSVSSGLRCNPFSETCLKLDVYIYIEIPWISYSHTIYFHVIHATNNVLHLTTLSRTTQ